MKRLLILLMIAAIAVPAFAAGSAQSEDEITVLASAEFVYQDGTSGWEIATAGVEKDFPGITVNILTIDMSDGSTLTLDAMLAAGNAPDVYEDFVARAAKLITPEWALPLDEYVRDIDAYNQDIVAAYRRGGKVYALPLAGGSQGMAVNLEIMGEIGYTIPDRWTVDDFLEMAELVKQHYDGEKWATGMFAANQSGDYLIDNWFPAFGVQRFAPGDYSSPTIAATGGEAVYEFFQHLVRLEYISPGAATLSDDDYVIQWAEGSLAATAFFEGWMKPYFDTVISQGVRDEPFDYMFVPFPRGPGVENVPSYQSNHVIVVNKDAANPGAAARWAEYYNSADQQGQRVLVAAVSPSRTDVTVVHPSPRIAEINAIVAAGGVADFGQTSPAFGAIRPSHFPVLQRVLNLAITPAEAVAEYERRLKEAIAE